MNNPPGYQEPGPNQLNENQKESLKLAKLGFNPTLYANVAGVIMGGEDRQDVLRKASVFVTARSTLTHANGGVIMYRDKTNKYDPFAVQIWLATSMRDGKFADHRMAGFMPRRICVNCWKSFGGKHADALQCPYCHGPLNYQLMSWLNKFLCETYFDKGSGIWYSVWWINQADPNSHWGCQLALGLPPVELQPPRR